MIFNLQVNILAAVLVSLILLNYKSSHVYLPENRSFRRILIHLLIILILDSIAWAVDHQTFKGALLISHIVNYFHYTEQVVIVYIWGLYSHQLNHIELSDMFKKLYKIPLIISLTLLAMNPFTQSVFRISADNNYSRGWGLWGSIYAFCAFSYLLEAMILALYRLPSSSKYKRKDNWNLFISSALPLLGAAVQMLFYGISTIWTCASIGTLILYLNVQTRHANQIEKELEEKRIAIMLSQIQPHFLYNTLISIEALCNIDPKTASTALNHFSHFLRGNMDSLLNTKLIPFNQELNHVKNYLYLQKVRFDERLNIIWEINFSDFLLPPLTVQPIVENAVRHGIMRKENGGSLTIRSENIKNQVIITIVDDGVGFHVEEINDDTHIGISNVKNRLQMQCNGLLIIESDPLEGTTSKIILPQK